MRSTRFLVICLPLLLLSYKVFPNITEAPQKDTIHSQEHTENHPDQNLNKPSNEKENLHIKTGGALKGKTDEKALASKEGNVHSGEHHGKVPPWWLVIPFISLLLMIATGPLFYARFWHKNYPVISILLGAFVVGLYVFWLDNVHQPVHSFVEYISFITLLASLFVASGGILIKVDKEGKPLTNVILLFIGSFIANLIGTTGASMLLIRPFIRLNQERIKAYHIVFFIFMISNVGGALTPIGDPPLFLGFLKGVPFFWTVTHVWIHWLFAIGFLGIAFYYLDRHNHAGEDHEEKQRSGKITIKGSKNFAWLAIIIISVFIDPNIYDWVPYIAFEGGKLSFVRETIMLMVTFLSYRTANKECLKGNEFNFEPIREVAYIFIGIFGTMMPALELVGNFASGSGRDLVNVSTLYWFTGSLSSVLDNAPTYLNFLAAGMAKFGLDINKPAQVLAFSTKQAIDLVSISVSAVFFGAMTYIGNGPNFMVKSIAEQVGVRMPSFFGYIIRYSLPILLPVLLLTYFVFFVIF